MYHYFQSRCAAVAFIVVMAAGIARAEWAEPQDKIMTEKQLVSFIEVMKQWIADQKAVEEQVKGKSGVEVLAVINHLKEQHEAALAAHGLSDKEFDWVGARASDARVAVFRDQMVVKMMTDSAAQLKTAEDQLAVSKQTLTVYQKAQQAGRRVMTADERKAAIDSATEEQKSAADEAKQHGDEAKAAEAEVAKADADQKTAETALKNPPKFDSDDDRNAFNDEKKNAIQAAKDARKEAADKLMEAKKAQAETLAKANTAAAKIKDPDVPLTDEDKAAVKQQNDEKMTELTEEVKRGEANNQQMRLLAAQILKGMQDDKERAPEQNIAIFKKHESEYDAALGINLTK